MAFPVAHYYCFTICELVQVVGLEVSELWDTDRHLRYEKAEIRKGFFSIDALQTAKDCLYIFLKPGRMKLKIPGSQSAISKRTTMHMR